MPVNFVIKIPGPESVLDELLVPEQAAELVPVTEGTLRARRYLRKPPSFIKVLHRVWYRRSVIAPASAHSLGTIALKSRLHIAARGETIHGKANVISGRPGRGRFAVATPGLISDAELAVKLNMSQRQIARWTTAFPDFPPRDKDPADRIWKRSTKAVGQWLLDHEVNL